MRNMARARSLLGTPSIFSCAFLGPAQLFPESPALTDSDSGSFSEEMNYHRERLPSIVLEPTEQSEGEGEEEGARDGGENTQEGDACGDQETGERQKEMER